MGNIKLACLCLLMYLWVPVAQADTCPPPVKEGENLVLNCTDEVKSTEEAENLRNFNWYKKSPASPEKEVMVDCWHFQRDSCSDGQNYSATLRRDNGHYSSSLLLPNVTADMDKTTIICMVDDFEDFRSALECRLSVFRPAQNVACKVVSQNANRVSVSCSAEDAFPRLLCELDGSPNHTVPLVKYSTCKNSEKNKRCALTCEIIFYLRGPNIKTFNIKVKSEGDTAEPKMVPLNVDSPSAAKELPELIITEEVEATDGCITVGSYKCKATSMPEGTSLTWFLQDGFGHTTNLTSAKPEKTQDRSAEARLELKLSHLQTVSEPNRAKLTCEVTAARNVSDAVCDGISGQNGRYPNDEDNLDKPCQKTVSLRNIQWPPTPSIRYSDKPRLGQSLELTLQQKVTLTCSIKGGNPAVSNSIVTCWNSYRNDTLHNLTVHGDSQNFTVHGNPNYHRAVCECTGSHVTKCKSSSEVEITVTGQAYKSLRQSTSWEDAFNSKIAVKHIGVGFAILIVFAVITGAFIYIKSHWGSLYQYFYSFTSRSKTDDYATYQNVTSLMEGRTPPPSLPCELSPPPRPPPPPPPRRELPRYPGEESFLIGSWEASRPLIPAVSPPSNDLRTASTQTEIDSQTRPDSLLQSIHIQPEQRAGLPLCEETNAKILCDSRNNSTIAHHGETETSALFHTNHSERPQSTRGGETSVKMVYSRSSQLPHTYTSLLSKPASEVSSSATSAEVSIEDNTRVGSTKLVNRSDNCKE